MRTVNFSKKHRGQCAGEGPALTLRSERRTYGIRIEVPVEEVIYPRTASGTAIWHRLNLSAAGNIGRYLCGERILRPYRLRAHAMHRLLHVGRYGPNWSERSRLQASAQTLFTVDGHTSSVNMRFPCTKLPRYLRWISFFFLFPHTTDTMDDDNDNRNRKRSSFQRRWWFFLPWVIA